MKRLNITISSAILFLCVTAMPMAVAGGGNGDQAVTAWVFVFNDPGNCDGPCDSIDDVFAANGAIVYLTGQRVQSNGRAIFAGSLSANVNHENIFGQLTNAGGAEIHVGIETHGRVAADAEDRALQTTINGVVCNPDCAIVQFAIFPAGAGLGTTQNGAVFWASDDSTVSGATATIRRVDVGDGDEMVVISIDTRL